MASEDKRDLVCDMYETWFNNEMSAVGYSRLKSFMEELRQTLQAYGKIRLFCWCAPKRCHGETIKKWLEENFK